LESGFRINPRESLKFHVEHYSTQSRRLPRRPPLDEKETKGEIPARVAEKAERERGGRERAVGRERANYGSSRFLSKAQRSSAPAEAVSAATCTPPPRSIIRTELELLISRVNGSLYYPAVAPEGRQDLDEVCAFIPEERGGGRGRSEPAPDRG